MKFEKKTVIHCCQRNYNLPFMKVDREHMNEYYSNQGYQRVVYTGGGGGGEGVSTPVTPPPKICNDIYIENKTF